MMFRNLITCLFGVLLWGCASTSPEPDATYYLVRHAEKVLDQPDPALTDAGQQRAEDLAERLKDANITKVYSSDYVRTRDTAAPLAEDNGLDVVLYDPRDLPGLAERLLDETGQIVVVGHSNTTPPLAELLGAAPGEPIVEATEYNRLYVITRVGESVTGEIQTYGK